MLIEFLSLNFRKIFFTHTGTERWIDLLAHANRYIVIHRKLCECEKGEYIERRSWQYVATTMMRNFSTLLFTWLCTWGFDQWTRYYVNKCLFSMLSNHDFNTSANCLIKQVHAGSTILINLTRVDKGSRKRKTHTACQIDP